MGLDMYIYKINKLSEYEKQEAERLRDPDQCMCTIMDKSDVDAEPNMYEDIIPYITEVDMKCMVFDRDTFNKDFGIPDDALRVGEAYGPTKVAFSYDNGQSVSVPMEEFEMYWKPSQKPAYLFKKKEMAYWRKAYELDDFIQAEITEIKNKERRPDEEPFCFENCGIYYLDVCLREKIQDFLEEHGLPYADSDFWMNEDMDLFYVAWW
jgi:protein tyrosine phosphatase